MQQQKNHGGANFAKKTGNNRKGEARYDLLSHDYNRLAQQNTIGTGQREVNGYHKPGSRKKIGG